MIRALAVLSLVLSLVAASLGYEVYRFNRVVKEAQAKVAGLETALATEQRLRQADQKALVNQATLKAEVRADERKSNAQLQEALRSESVWADQLVPAGVADAFRVPSSTKH